jgi:hypothetical protein
MRDSATDLKSDGQAQPLLHSSLGYRVPQFGESGGLVQPNNSRTCNCRVASKQRRLDPSTQILGSVGSQLATVLTSQMA